MNAADLAVVATYPSIVDAQIAQGVLEGDGIESIIRTENAGGMYPSLSGADLLVKTADAERAGELLRQHEETAK